MSNHLDAFQDKNTQQKLSTILFQIVGEVLEKYCGVFPKEKEELFPKFFLEQGVSIEFQGPVCGRLNFLIHGKISSFLASKIFNHTPSEAEILDAIQELASIICRNFLPYLVGPEATYQTNSSLWILPSPQNSQEFLLLTTYFLLENGYLETQIYLVSEN